MLYLVAVLMLVTALVMLQIAKKKPAAASGPKKPQPTVESSPFASVRLRCDRHACAPALEMRDLAFLASEAPTLPLSKCDATHCQCKYAKASDRRATEGRRAMDLGIQPIIFDGTENREDDRRDSNPA